MESIKTSAIVIKSINWSDSSKIITLFTREKGCVDVVAKGSRKIKSQFQGILESLNLIESIIYFSPKRELQTLGEVSLENSFQSIRSDLEKTSYSLSILELIQIFFHRGDGDQIFFDFLRQIFLAISQTDEPEKILWYFMLKLSSYLGFKPEFEVCRICNKNIQHENIEFNLAEGSVICGECSNLSETKNTILKCTSNYLASLQKTSPKKILYTKLPQNLSFPYTRFLLSYLQYHTEQKLELSSMKYFK